MKVNKKAFFDEVRATLFKGKMTQTQVDGINQVIDDPLTADMTAGQIAYVLATAHHEVGATFQPIEEGGKGKGKKYGSKIKYSGQKYETPDKLYYGRGLVQLTWYENYEKFGKILNLPLLEQPELALRQDVSTRILLIGMKRGLFTGVGLSRYINNSKMDFRNARRIINILDRAELIAGYAEKYLTALRK